MSQHFLYARERDDGTHAPSSSVAGGVAFEVSADNSLQLLKLHDIRVDGTRICGLLLDAVDRRGGKQYWDHVLRISLVVFDREADVAWFDDISRYER